MALDISCPKGYNQVLVGWLLPDKLNLIESLNVIIVENDDSSLYVRIAPTLSTKSLFSILNSSLGYRCH